MCGVTFDPPQARCNINDALLVVGLHGDNRPCWLLCGVYAVSLRYYINLSKLLL